MGKNRDWKPVVQHTLWSALMTSNKRIGPSTMQKKFEPLSSVRCILALTSLLIIFVILTNKWENGQNLCVRKSKKMIIPIEYFFHDIWKVGENDTETGWQTQISDATVGGRNMSASLRTFIRRKGKKIYQRAVFAIVFYQYNDRDNNFREFLKTAIQSKLANFGNFWEETRHFFK